MHDPSLAFTLECLISCSARGRCSTLHTIFNIFFYIFTHIFTHFFVQNVYFRNSVPTETWKQPSRKSELNPPSKSIRECSSLMTLLCLHQQKFWAHLVIREASICWYMSNERGTGLSDTSAHTDTLCSTRPHKSVADPICSPLHSQGFVYLMQNQYLYFQDNESNVLME